MGFDVERHLKNQERRFNNELKKLEGQIMSDDKKKEVKLVTPTGRICFLRNLFESGGDKNKFSAALILSSQQDKKKLQALMMAAIKEKGFTKADTLAKNSKGESLWSWGMKLVDLEDLDFCNEGDTIVNFDRNGDFGPPEVKGINKGPDGKYENLIDGDIKAGDHCRILVTAFAWSHKKAKGVKFNFNAVQFIKEGEAYYSAPTSDSDWDETEFDVELPDDLADFNTEANDSQEAPADDGWDEAEF